MEEILSLTRLGIALAFMMLASVMDWRTRKVRNRVWIALGTAGIAILALEMLLSMTDQAPRFGTGHLLVFVPIAIIFYDVFWDREPVYWEGRVNPVPVLLYAIAGVFVAMLLVLEGLTRETASLLSVPAIMLVFVAFYYLGIIRGGADAKALMALALMFPLYPMISGLPLIAHPETGTDILQAMFPFAFLILMNAAIIHAVSGPAIRFFKNLARKDIGFPEMFLGYRMDIAEVPKKFVWPMEAVRDDEIVLLLFPSRNTDLREELAKLRAKGAEKIWVTPKDPFIIPMTVGLLFSVIIGNIVMLLFSF